MKESSGERKVKTSHADALVEHGWLLSEPAPRIDVVECDGVEVTCVRDDLLHPWAGGNKLRKLDAILPAVLSRGRDVVTCGGAQSAHTAALAGSCAERGARCHVLSRGEPHEVRVGYALMTEVFAATVRHVSRDDYARRVELMEEWAADLSAEVVPEGGAMLESSYGMVRLVEGLVEALGRAPRTLVVDSGTGATATGLALACAWLELPWSVEGVMLLDAMRGGFAETSARLHDAWVARHGVLPQEFALDWVPRPTKRRFGSANRGDVQECVRIARETGVVFDPIYTLEAWRYVVSMPPERRRDAVLIHTGGALHLAGVAQRWPGWIGREA